MQTAVEESIMTVKSYVGTYADQIIYLELDTNAGRFGASHTAAKLPAPSYCVAADGKYLVVCSEVERFDGRYGGGLVSYRINGDGTLFMLSRVCTGGTITCHVAFEPASRCVAAANYGDGSFAVCTLDENGLLSEPQIFVKHVGSGPDKSRQAGPHAHQCVFAGETLWVCDLGLDAAIQYALEGEAAREQRRLNTPPGSGARHMAFDKSGRYAYVLCEMKSIVAAFDLSKDDGNLDALYSLTDGSDGPTGAAAIRCRPDDVLLIATNRFKNNISLYAADGTALELLDRVACGNIPRDAAFVPGADLVVAGFQDDSRAVMYNIKDRRLEIIDEIQLPRPVCFCFI
jgi:6-phosphogluconolactonase